MYALSLAQTKTFQQILNGKAKTKTKTWHLTSRNETKRMKWSFSCFLFLSLVHSHTRFQADHRSICKYLTDSECRELMKCVCVHLKKRKRIQSGNSSNSNNNYDRRHRKTFKNGVHLFCPSAIFPNEMGWKTSDLVWVPCSIVNCLMRRQRWWWSNLNWRLLFGTYRIQRAHNVDANATTYSPFTFCVMISMSTSRIYRYFSGEKDQLVKLEHCFVKKWCCWNVLFEFMPTRNPMESQYPIKMFRMKKKHTHKYVFIANILNTLKWEWYRTCYKNNKKIKNTVCIFIWWCARMRCNANDETVLCCYTMC